VNDAKTGCRIVEVLPNIVVAPAGVALARELRRVRSCFGSAVIRLRRNGLNDGALARARFISLQRGNNFVEPVFAATI
jgi:hypothetical protein